MSEFRQLRQPVLWIGHYKRIPGKNTIFKAGVNGRASVRWSPWQSDELMTSFFAEENSVEEMVSAVNEAKEGFGAGAGGGFMINERGQVIVPMSESGAKYWVGNFQGTPILDDPRDGSDFTMTAPRGAKCGDLWDRPYLGMIYNLMSDDSITYEKEDADGSRRIALSTAYDELTEALRSLRHGTIRFIVNLHGVVLTKLEGDAKPVYVTTIDMNSWFPLETPKHTFR
jgi:hypothetical protein